MKSKLTYVNERLRSGMDSNDLAKWLIGIPNGTVFREYKENKIRYVFKKQLGGYPCGLGGVCIELSDSKNNVDIVAIGHKDNVFLELKDGAIKYDHDEYGEVLLFPVTTKKEFKLATEEIGEIEEEDEEKSETKELHIFDELDIVETPNGEIAIIDEISRNGPESNDEASITYITNKGKDYKTAWWDVSEFTFIKNFSELLKEMIKQ